MKRKTAIVIIMILALLASVSACKSKKEVNSYDGKCDNCGRTAIFGGNGNPEFCADCFESFLNFVYEN